MKWPKNNSFDIESCTILAGYVGSIAHGTYTVQSDEQTPDKDIMGVCVPPIEYYFGLKKFEQVVTYVSEYDTVIYEARKFIQLLLSSNPNMLQLLWLRDEFYVKRSEFGDRLIAERDIFSSIRLYPAFVGCANSCMHKLNTTRKNSSQSKRSDLICKYGYDVKNAMHLIRILKTGIEFFTTGQLNVHREDSEQLVGIKKGFYRLDEIKEWADDLFDQLHKASDSAKLPSAPNYARAHELLIEGVREKLIT